MKSIRVFVLACAAFAVAACDSSNNRQFERGEGAEPGEFALLQVLHGSADAPAVNVLVDGSVALRNVGYKAGSNKIPFSVGTYSISVEGILPDGSTATVLGPLDVALASGKTYTVTAVGSCGDPACSQLDVNLIEQDDTPVGAGNARVFVQHGTQGPLLVDVYVTGPDVLLEEADPLATFDFKGTIGPAELAADTYRIRVTPADNKALVAYDSGPVPLAEGDDLVLTAVPASGFGPALVTLVGLNGDVSFELPDARTTAGLRIGHLSPDTGAVDVWANGEIFGGLDNVPFPAVTGIYQIPPDTYTIAVTDGENAGVMPIGPVDLTFDGGVYTSIFAVNSMANIEPLILDQDDPRPLATAAKVRIVHAASNPAAASVDVYVTAPEAGIADIEPTIRGFAFKDNTGYIQLPAGAYEVNVTLPDTKDVAIGPAVFEVAEGDVFTAIARDEADYTGFGLTIVSDAIEYDD